MKITVESWAPEYGSPLETGDLGDPEVPTDLSVEMPVDSWEPIAPGAETTRPDTVYFVDGVRRIDAVVWITDDDETTRMGICASYAAGTVRCGERAELVDSEVRRVLVSTAGAPALDTEAGRFEPYAVADDAINTLSIGLQGRLGDLEVEVANRIEADDAMIVLDGPLNRGRHHISGAVGYVKTHRVSYLPTQLSKIVGQMKPGERTPVFLTQTTWSRYSWYLKLPGGEGHPWSGVVRCEASAEGEIADVITLAGQTASLLPRYASERHKETRAPQNLFTISSLESELRRRLGHPAQVHRLLLLATERL